MLKLVAISDTHLQHWSLKIPDGDVLIHAGDALSSGRPKEFEDFSKWWNAQPHPYKIFVPGNHDEVCQQNEEWARAGLKDTYFLIDEGCSIKGIHFWGTPWQPPFHDWAFNANAEFRRMKFSQIAKDTLVLISHAPPYGYLDVVTEKMNNECLGDIELKAATRKPLPAVHIFGHIHSGSGVSMRVESYGDGTYGTGIVANASICNEGYKPVNSPLIIWV